MSGCGGAPAGRDAIVVGGSMFPTLVGEHLASNCPDCGFAFLADAGGIPRSGKLVCPNCGFAEIAARSATRRAATQIEVDEGRREPDRGELICYRQAGSDRIAIKRVVGLPGETVELLDGQIWIDGRRLNFPRGTAGPWIHVYDSRWQPAPRADLQNRWLPQNPEASHWQRKANAYEWRAANPQVGGRGTDERAETDWLEYQHWRCFAHRGRRDAPFPIEDHYGFNQALARTLNDVLEWDLTLDLSLGAGSALVVKLAGNPEIEIRLSTDFENHVGRYQWTSGERSGEGSIKLASPQNGESAMALRLEWRTLGGVSQLSLGGKPIAKLPPQIRSDPPAAPAPIAAVGARRGRVEISRLTIQRDVFYEGGGGTTRWALGADEYLVLGDNPPISRDSRQLDPPLIDRSEILGIARLPAGGLHSNSK